MTDAEINRRLAEALGDEYKQIPNHPGYYISKSGVVFSEKTNRIRVNGTCGKYQQIALTNFGDKRIYRYLVHRLVARVFIGPCPIGMEVCHIDGNPQNNHVANLKYATRKENAQHKFAHGTMPMGERNLAAKLSMESVQNIRREYVPGKHGVTSKNSMRNLAAKYGVGVTAIKDILHGKTWQDPRVLALAALRVMEETT